jgi:hypothetical protein
MHALYVIRISIEHFEIDASDGASQKPVDEASCLSTEPLVSDRPHSSNE